MPGRGKDRADQQIENSHCMLKAVKNNVFRVCNKRWNILELLDVDFPRSTVLFGARFERSVITHLVDAVRRRPL